MRLFAALRPPVEVLDHLGAALDAVGRRSDERPGALRWVAPSEQHVTLAFYGEVPEGRMPELTDDLARTAHGVLPFALALSGAGLVDRRVLWTGCAGDTAALAGLMAGAAAAAPTAVADGRVRSRAHLTVARVRDRAGRNDRQNDGSRGPGGRARPAGLSPAEVVRALAVYRGPVWTVEELVLVESRLGAGPHGGPLYTDVAELPLWSQRAVPRADRALWQDGRHGAAPRSGE